MPTYVEEPNQQHFIVDNTFRSNTLNSDTVVAGVISAPTGPCDEMVINNVAELCDLYLNSDTVSSNADTTILHAAKILQFSPMHIVRAANANVKAGITNNGDTIFTDANYVPYKQSKTYKFNDTNTDSLNGFIGFVTKKESGEISGIAYDINGKPDKLNEWIASKYKNDNSIVIESFNLTDKEESIGIDPVFDLLKKSKFNRKISNVGLDFTNEDFHTVYTTGGVNVGIYPGFSGEAEDTKWVSLSKSNISSSVWKFDSVSGNEIISEGSDSVSLNNYSFYLAPTTDTGSAVVDIYGTGIPIYIPREEGTGVSANVFALHVFDEISKDSRFKNPIISNVDSSVEFEIPQSGSTPNYLTIISNMDDIFDIAVTLNDGTVEGVDLSVDGTGSVTGKRYSNQTSSGATITTGSLKVVIKSKVEDSTVFTDGRFVIFNVSEKEDAYNPDKEKTGVKGVKDETSSSDDLTSFTFDVKGGEINPGYEVVLKIKKGGDILAKSSLDISQGSIFKTWSGPLASYDLYAEILGESSEDVKIKIYNFDFSNAEITVEIDYYAVEFLANEFDNTFAYFYNMTTDRSYKVCNTIVCGAVSVPMAAFKLGVAMTSDFNDEHFNNKIRPTQTNASIYKVGNVEFFGLKSLWRTFTTNISAFDIDSPEESFFRTLITKDKENLTNSKSKFVLKFNNIVFWNGEAGLYTKSSLSEDDYQVDNSSSGMTFNDFMAAVVEELPSFYSVMPSISNGNEVTLFSNAGDFNPVVKFGTIDKVSIVNPESEKDYEFELSSRFAMMATYPSSSKIFGLTLIDRGDDTWDMTIRRKSTTANFNVSFVPGTVNGYGVGIYADYVNENAIDYKYIDLNLNADPVEIDKEITFGDEIVVPVPGLTQRKNALSKLTLDTGYYYNFITELGYNHVSYDTYATSIAEELNAQYVTSAPRDYLVHTDIIKYRDDTKIDSRNASMFTPYYKDSTIGNFIVDLSPSTEFLRRFYTNKALFKEFGPCFGPVCGETTITTKRSSSSGLLVDFNTRDVREQLLTKQVNPIKIDRGAGSTYFTDNWTMQKKDSYLSDFQNMYATNVIQHILDQFMKQYFASANNKAVRDNVVTVLTKAIEERLFANQSYTPISFEVICDESNNPDSVVADRKLIVDIKIIYNVAIKYIKTYTRILPISEA